MARTKDESRNLNENEKRVIVSLAQNGLNRGKAAKELHYHFNSVSYIASRIRWKTGLNPMDFYDMIKLIDMAKGGEADGSD